MKISIISSAYIVVNNYINFFWPLLQESNIGYRFHNIQTLRGSHSPDWSWGDQTCKETFPGKASIVGTPGTAGIRSDKAKFKQGQHYIDCDTIAQLQEA